MSLDITITNYSTGVWTLNNWKAAAGSSDYVGVSDVVTNSPTPKLLGNGDVSEASALSDHLSFLVETALYLIVGYVSDDDPSAEFAVRVQQYFHLVTLGYGCEWQYWRNGSWSDMTADATPQVWQFGSSSFKVDATPTLGDDGKVDVVISGSKKKP